MAIKLTSLSETFEVAVFQDDALDMTRKEYLEYIKTCDKSLLKCVEGKTPTFFVLKKVLRYEDGKKIKANQVGYRDDMVVMDSSFTIEDIRLSLCAVVNPPDLAPEHHIQFKVENGGAPQDLMAYLIATGGADDLYAAKQYMTGSKAGDKELDKKK